MQIDILHIAKLARLSIEEEKIAKFQSEMENIVAMCEKLPPMEGSFTAVDPSNPMQLREDEVRPSLKRDLLLKNAPQTQAGCVVVPKVVE
ncbi:MAG: Asp-tRNA(Asn)/Glu-tRNA(Gln) amidotransferase subunit GatC [Oscillospiraceae bacterium]|nr:Asp-tRNA(Asn)/Glu-tRNA(Gln) amidotransferase subunit GatC [Oscillospiraceae bacterium]MBQ3242753.1 Asp-tRNA(Asn)/Glu-tRNA(Gln) amidotransferase subunit GatC [Oscillospiraceae bacterium]MBQ7083409.1 Asp-tRNA(Asn)/Glu-tRNA(Gln) amidotransferase subunit GatC [Oscillospiraceae bacterium]MBR2635846.1 Asp-tRNA(Asn)/Glu-tRNA(Gln) amidotransferase subunit GatC [Oscillospiraceae bacterium]MBR6607567.1 Asp-tRNA(Asn)/Glu-tRNA(Gln) amidotransferase subunit GatC [Oscillospiraceae bacterium]